jgi:hypothetical protein
LLHVRWRLFLILGGWPLAPWLRSGFAGFLQVWDFAVASLVPGER